MLSIVTITLEPLRKKEEQKLVFRQPFTGPQNTMVPFNSRIFFNHLQFPLDFLVFIGYLLMPPTVKYRFYTGTLFCKWYTWAVQLKNQFHNYGTNIKLLVIKITPEDSPSLCYCALQLFR